MVNFWQEYWYSIRRPTYLFLTFIFPLFIFTVPIFISAVLVLAFRAALPEPDLRPIGLVDLVGLISPDVRLPNEPVPVSLYNTLPQAVQALQTGDIQAYYHLGPDYWATGTITVTYEQAPNFAIQNMMSTAMHQFVRQQVPPTILDQYSQNINIVQHGTTSEKTFSQTSFTEWGAVFFIIYFVFQINIFTSARVFDTITSEVENKTIEILITSITPLQWVLGKLCALITVGLTQLSVWGGGILALILMVSYLADFDLISLVLAWEQLWFLATFLFASHIMYQILAAAFGLLRVSGGMGVQLLNAFGWVVGISLIYVMYFVPRNPDTWLAIFGSLFPFTAPIIMPVRNVVSSVPSWQLILAQVLLWGTNILGILWIKALLKANLVKYSAMFSFGQWLKNRPLMQKLSQPLIKLGQILKRPKGKADA